MNRNDITIASSPYASIPSMRWTVAAGTPPTIKAGEPVKVGTLPNVALFADGEGTTSEEFVGIAQGDSAETASAEGYVEVFEALPWLLYEGAAKTSTAADTQTEIDDLHGKQVVWDLTSSKFTIDTAAADSASNCLKISGKGDPNRSVVHFIYTTDGSYNFSG